MKINSIRVLFCACSHGWVGMVKSGPSLGLHERALSEAPLLLPKLDALKDLYTWKILSPPDVCVSYILITLALRHGPDRMVVGTRQPQESCCEVPAELPFQSASLAEHQVQQLLGSDVISDRTLSRLHLNRESATIRDFWMKARLHKISDYVPVCLDGFYSGLRPLKLMFRIPDPAELLAMQAAGARCVSALTSSKMLTQVFGHRDCLEMLLHDLAHMEKFVEGGRFYQQVGFFVFLHSSVAPFHEKWRKNSRSKMGALLALCVSRHERGGESHVYDTEVSADGCHGTEDLARSRISNWRGWWSGNCQGRRLPASKHGRVEAFTLRRWTTGSIWGLSFSIL